MKVKNIAFSGFAAMIFAGLCGVASAASVNLVTKSYVDDALETKADLIDLDELKTTVGQKATQESLELVATQVNQNTLDIADLKAAGYLTETDLDDLKNTLQAAIDEKQAKGDYADAAELETLKTTVETLQSGTVDKAVVENLQTTVNAISADYAKKSELTSAEERLQAAIDAIKIPSLDEYAKITYVDEQLASKADASALNNLVTSQQLADLRTALEAEIANRQEKGDYAAADALTAVSTELATLKNGVYTKAEVDQKIAEAATGGEIDLSGYATTSALDALTLLVNGNTTEINALKNAGYQTSSQVQGAITAAIADVATDQELANLQTTLVGLINAKQDAGEYLVAADLTTLNDAITALQTGKADASTVETIQQTIDKLGDTYATDTELANAIAAINIPSLEGYVKSSDLAAVATSGQYADLEGKPEIPSIAGLATEQALTNLQTTLQAAIDEKQAAGEYLVAADLTTLNDAITALQTGKADKSTVETIQTTINNLGNTYATKSDMTAADTALQNAIDAIEIPSLAEYAKTADVYTKEQADAKFLIMQDANALGANLQWDEDGKLNTKGIATAEGLEELESKVASAVTESELEAKGYLTADSELNGAKITAGTVAKTALADDVQTSLGLADTALQSHQSITTGTENGTIAVDGADVAVAGLGSAAYTETSDYVGNPTLPTDDGDYMLMVESNGGTYKYTWTNIKDYHPDDDWNLWE